MPFGRVISAVFFLSMTIAALSSLLPMMEVGVRNFMDAGMERHKATLFLIVGGFILGVPSAYSLDFLNNQDWVLGVALLVSGLFVAIAMIKYGLEKARKEDINTPWADIKVNKWWTYSIASIPVLFVILTGWWLMQAKSWNPDSWLDPFGVSSVGTVLFQFAIILVLSLATNNYFAKKISKKE
jgi:NSS family neurotransmitter:Na+ symporter